MFGIASKGIVLSGELITKMLIRLCRCTGWSSSLLFSYDINRLLHIIWAPSWENKAQISLCICAVWFSTFIVRCLDSKSLLAIAEISGLYLVTVAEQAGLKPYLVANPMTGFLVTWLILTMTTDVHAKRLRWKEPYVWPGLTNERPIYETEYWQL